MIGVGKEKIELAVMQRIEIHLPVLEVVLLDKSCRLKAALDLVPDGQIRAHRLVSRVPEPNRLLRDGDVEALLQVADGVTGGVAQVVAPDRFHDDLDRIRGMLSDLVDKGMAAGVAAPALALLMARPAPAFLDHVLTTAKAKRPRRYIKSPFISNEILV